MAQDKISQQIPLSEEAVATDRWSDDALSAGTHVVLADIAYRRLGIVNVVYAGEKEAGDRGWVLIDAGLIGTKALIEAAATERFGENARPAAIILTHGHFDHVGAVEDLAAEWDVPVYAHELEMPYLDGSASYPQPAPEAGGGLMAALSPFFPRKPVNLGKRLRPLPEDGSVPFMDGWRWIATPGHSVGHVSFWREADRTLIAGDAIVTTAQESAYSALTQEPQMHGPPAYFTVDWEAARTSVEAIAALDPELVLCGHGEPMRGAEMRVALHRLAREFDMVAVPRRSKYKFRPAKAGDRSAYKRP